jgi:hypothetical protein
MIKLINIIIIIFLLTPLYGKKRVYKKTGDINIYINYDQVLKNNQLQKNQELLKKMEKEYKKKNIKAFFTGFTAGAGVGAIATMLIIFMPKR